MVGGCDQRAYLLFGVVSLLRGEIAACGDEAEMFLVGAVLFKQIVGQAKHFLEVLVPCHQVVRLVE